MWTRPFYFPASHSRQNMFHMAQVLYYKSFTPFPLHNYIYATIFLTIFYKSQKQQIAPFRLAICCSISHRIIPYSVLRTYIIPTVYKSIFYKHWCFLFILYKHILFRGFLYHRCFCYYRLFRNHRCFCYYRFFRNLRFL